MTPKEVRQLWIQKLESGEVKQAWAALGYPTGERCCLGVLCDIAVEQGIISPPTTIGDSAIYCELAYEGETNHLPPIVSKWVGLRSDFGQYEGTCLTELNDTEHLTFPEIAAVLREAPKGLFVEDSDV